MKYVLLNDSLQILLSPFQAGAIINEDGKILSLKAVAPSDIGHLPLIAQNIRRYFPLQGGDICIVNEPATGARMDRLSFLTACKLHDQTWYFVTSTDIGVTSLRIPPTPIVQGWKINQDLLSALTAGALDSPNLKTAVLDQVDSLTNLNRTLQTLVSSQPHLFSKSRQIELLDKTHKLVQKIFQEVPHGESKLDLKFEPHQSVSLKIGFDKELMVFDFSGTPLSKQIGLTPAAAFGSCTSALIKFLDKPIPLNSGFFECISVSTPAQSWFNIKLQEQKKNQLDPLSDLISTLGFNCLSHLYRGNSNQQHFQSQLSVKLTFSDQKSLQLNLPSGLSADSHKFGEDSATNWFSSTKLLSVEDIERSYPIQVMEFQKHTSSTSGKGAHSGGRGVVFKIKVLDQVKLEWTTGLGLQHIPGLSGGGPGSPHELITHESDKDETPLVLTPEGVANLNKNTVLTFITATGASWGKSN